MGIRLTGVKEAVANLRGVQRVTPQALAAALNIEAELAMTDSKRNTPVAPGGGTLRSSGRVQKPEIRGSNVSVTLGYGGAASAYALAVHEFPSKHSPPSWQGKSALNWNVGGPKFLENAVKQREKTLGRSVARRLAKAWLRVT